MRAVEAACLEGPRGRTTRSIARAYPIPIPPSQTAMEPLRGKACSRAPLRASQRRGAPPIPQVANEWAIVRFRLTHPVRIAALSAAFAKAERLGCKATTDIPAWEQVVAVEAELRAAVGAERPVVVAAIGKSLLKSAVSEPRQ